MSEQFYLQDSRSYVGNDMVFWCKDGGGYTTDVSKAGVWTKDDAQAQHNMRETDIPWPKEYIDAKTRPAVDMQYVRRNEALADTGIELHEPPKYKKSRDTINCGTCGSFANLYLKCKRCGSDNRP